MPHDANIHFPTPMPRLACLVPVCLACRNALVANGRPQARPTAARRGERLASAKAVKRTPLWTLKVTQMLLFAANVCLVRFITVFYHEARPLSYFSISKGK